MFKRWMIYLEADKGVGNSEDDKETEDATGEENGGQNKQASEPTFTQANIDRIVQEQLERERKKSDEKARKAKEEAEAKAQEEQQKFQEVAEKRGAKVDGGR